MALITSEKCLRARCSALVCHAGLADSKIQPFWALHFLFNNYGIRHHFDSGLFCCVSQLFRFQSWPRGSRYQSVLYQKPKWCLKIEIIVKHSLHTFSWMSPCLSWLVQTAFLCFLLSERSSTINKVKAGYKANGPSPHEECGRQTLFCPCAI